MKGQPEVGQLWRVAATDALLLITGVSERHPWTVICVELSSEAKEWRERIGYLLWVSDRVA